MTFRTPRPGASTTRRLSAIALLVLFAVLATACQPEEPQETSTASEPTATQPAEPAAVPTPEPTEEPATGELTLNDELSHRDLVSARQGLERARVLWEAGRPTNYVITVSTGCECANFTVESLVFDDRGTISRLDTEYPEASAFYPTTADDLFARAEALLAALEADPSTVSQQECDGDNRYLRFDPTTGAPLHVSDNTPCDGGVGWNAKYEDLDDLGGPIADRQDFDIVEFSEINPDPAAGPIKVITSQSFAPEGAPVTAEDFVDFCAAFADQHACAEQAIAIVADPQQTLVTTPCVQCAATRVWLLQGLDGQVASVQDQSTLRQLLGEIDTSAEAQLMAQDLGPVRAIESGWELLKHTTVLDCDPVVGRNAVVVVTTDGAVYESGRTYDIAENVCI